MLINTIIAIVRDGQGCFSVMKYSLELAIVIVGVVVLILYVTRAMRIMQLIDYIVSRDENIYMSFMQAMHLADTFNVLCAILVIMAVMRLSKLFRLIPKHQKLRWTLWLACPNLIALVLATLVISTGFGIAGYLMFGSRFFACRNFGACFIFSDISVPRHFRVAFGVVYEPYYYMALFFTIFLYMAKLLLNSMFLAEIISAYRFAKWRVQLKIMRREYYRYKRNVRNYCKSARLRGGVDNWRRRSRKLRQRRKTNIADVSTYFMESIAIRVIEIAMNDRISIRNPEMTARTLERLMVYEYHEENFCINPSHGDAPNLKNCYCDMLLIICYLLKNDCQNYAGLVPLLTIQDRFRRDLTAWNRSAENMICVLMELLQRLDICISFDPDRMKYRPYNFNYKLSKKKQEDEDKYFKLKFYPDIIYCRSDFYVKLE